MNQEYDMFVGDMNDGDEDSDDDEPLDKKIRVIEEKEEIVTVKAEPIPECIEHEEPSSAQNDKPDISLEKIPTEIFDQLDEKFKKSPPEVPNSTLYKEMSRFP